MFYYFGRKGRLAGKYPKPLFETVIEPFAGSAAYSLHWAPHKAVLIERDQRVVDLWRRLIEMGKDEIAAAEVPALGSRCFDPWYLISLASSGSLSIQNGIDVNKWGQQSWEWSRKVALKHYDVAKRFDYIHGDYTDAPDIDATWFIDPPYQKVQKGYKFNRTTIDYEALAEWVLTRRGQVIVCEQEGADWLPFESFTTHQNLLSKPSREVIWTRNVKVI